jgi:predicted P-loop ATPase
MPNISLFGAVYDVLSDDNFPIEAYLTAVKTGTYEDEVYKIRIEKNDKTRANLKRHLKRVTFSGMFSKREDAGLIEHSGYIAIDLDDISEIEETKRLLSEDRFVYSVFVSSSGTGLTVLFKINPSKHRLSFLGISEYILYNYNILPDPQSISVSKPFGVTYDPFIYVAEKQVATFTMYPKEKPVEKVANFAFAKSDFDDLLKALVQRNISICEGYDEWLKIGFAFVDKFGESGRGYYHVVSSVSKKYTHERTDKQYNYCLRSKNLNLATIKTFYYYCKEAGLQISSPQTAKVRKVTLNAKSAGLKKEQIIKNLKEIEGIDGVDDLVSEVFDSKPEIEDGDSIIAQLEFFVSTNYKLERNKITRYIELNGNSLEQKDLNTIYIAAKKIITSLTYSDFERLIMSDFVSSYNPILRFFQALPEIKVKNKDEFISPLIDKLASCIVNDISPYTEYFLRKWLVSSMSAIHGEHSPLMLVLSGEKHGKGKTEFFRRLLPDELKRYYAESKLDSGKDDEILMTQKWFIMDDEMSGKSKRETQRLKELTSKQWFSLREPYGRMNVDLFRVAVLCATTNSKEVLADTSGNRRIIPIPVDYIDKNKYNSINKTDLFNEAYWLWKNDFEWRVIEDDDMDYLNMYKSEFEVASIEKDLLLKYFTPEMPNSYMNTTELKVDLELMTQQRLNLSILGKHLLQIGYGSKSIRVGKQVQKKWAIRKINRLGVPDIIDSGDSTKEKNNGFEPIEGEGF